MAFVVENVSVIVLKRIDYSLDLSCHCQLHYSLDIEHNLLSVLTTAISVDLL